MTTRFWTAFASLALILTLSPSAEAGIVILKNGKVIVGDIDKAKETEDYVLVVFKRGEDKTQGRGETKVPRATIRWYNRDTRVPTDAYWEKHETDKIESKWVPFRERWKIAKDVKEQNPELSTDDPNDLAKKGLAKTGKTSKTAKPSKTAKTAKTAGIAPAPAANAGCKQSCSIQATHRTGNALWLGLLLLGLVSLRRPSASEPRS